VYDKSGTPQAGPTEFIELFDGAGGVCETDIEGSPNVLYDSEADRWLLSQYADPIGARAMCLAVSTTSDPAGAYFTYEFILPEFPLDPKLGVWQDAYYLGTNSGFSNLF
jgi:hypothetical protein